jgi:hypothetical protein
MTSQAEGMSFIMKVRKSETLHANVPKAATDFKIPQGSLKPPADSDSVPYVHYFQLASAHSIQPLVKPSWQRLHLGTSSEDE